MWQNLVQMKNIVPPPDLVITIPYFCHICETETEHEVLFKAWNYQQRAVSYDIMCECCRVDVIKQWLPVSEWMEMLSEVSDRREN